MRNKGINQEFRQDSCFQFSYAHDSIVGLTSGSLVESRPRRSFKEVNGVMAV